MDCEGYPFQGTQAIRKSRYLGSIFAHCIGTNLPVVCYTHEKSLQELVDLKNQKKLENLEIKIMELNEMKLHERIKKVRDKNFDINLEGRGTEIMWGKFDVLERELEGCDQVFWVDAGLQNPSIFPWRYCKKYNKKEDHDDLKAAWWSDLDVFDFKSLFNHLIFEKLKKICNDKICFLAVTNPQISYLNFFEKEIFKYNISSPYPVGGMFGGNVNLVKKFISHCWEICDLVLDNSFLCTEESIMKFAYDKMNKDETYDLLFSSYHNGHFDHDQFHFEMWSEESGLPKPLYMVWLDLLKL